MRVLFYVILIISWTQHLRAQTGEINITQLAPAYKDYKFPCIVYAKNELVERKINLALQLEHLKHLPNNYKLHPFELICSDSNRCCGSTKFLEWKQTKSPKNILSTTLNGEVKGSYSEAFSIYHNFDLRTGNEILGHHFFTLEGMQVLRTLINNEAKQKIQKFIEKIKASSDSTSEKYRDEILEPQISLYEDCLKSVEDDDISFPNFYFGVDSISFVKERCSDHATRAIDHLDRYFINISYKEIERYLSVYGKNLLSGSAIIAERNTPESNCFKGFIDGKYPITAMLFKAGYDRYVQMYYWHDKINKPIPLIGQLMGYQLTLTEEEPSNNSDESPIIKARIDVNWMYKKKLVGTWQDEETKKIMKLELEMY
jgi:hypothetical protein